MTRSDKLVALELQYRTKASMCIAISFQDRTQEISQTTQEKGKVPGEEQNQNKSSVFYSVYISKPAGGQAPIVSTVVGLLDNLSHGVILKGRLYVVIRPITRR